MFTGIFAQIIFLSTLSLRRATLRPCFSRSFLSNFYPRSPCGERLSLFTGIFAQIIFLSTLSLRRATFQLVRWVAGCIVFLSTLSLRRATRCNGILPDSIPNFYPRSPCGERLRIGTNSAGFNIISIHALLAESDIEGGLHRRCTTHISIHALLAESDEAPGRIHTGPARGFLSTLSLRRATSSSAMFSRTAKNFYPRSPCGERPTKDSKQSKTDSISIHALLAESDRSMAVCVRRINIFLSTLSLRRATYQ